MADASVLATVAAPALGAALANIMFLAHMPAVRAAIRTQKLGKINPDPFKMIIGCALCWTLFGFVTNDVYIIASNLPGVNLGIYYYTVAYGLTECMATRRRMEAQVHMLLAFMSTLGFCALYVDMTAVIGTSANILAVIMFGSPLTQIRSVIREKDSASVDRRFMVAQIINCVMWIVYSLATRKYFITPPNVLGLLLGLIQLSVVCIYPRRTASESGTKGATKGDLEKGDAESTEGSTKSPTEPEAEERAEKEAQGTETC
jgi:solute carrier family 50 protein (sugar transporter)